MFFSGKADTSHPAGALCCINIIVDFSQALLYNKYIGGICQCMLPVYEVAHASTCDARTCCVLAGFRESSACIRGLIVGNVWTGKMLILCKVLRWVKEAL